MLADAISGEQSNEGLRAEYNDYGWIRHVDVLHNPW